MTKTIVTAALEGDPKVTSHQLHEVLAVLTSQTSNTDQNKEVLLVNQAEAARMLSVSRFTIRRLVLDGVIEAVRIRGTDRYRVADLHGRQADS
jgi:excisionase family DNA binding protein